MNARALLPDGITATQSYAWVLREVFLDKLASLSFFSGFNVRRTRRVAIQAAQLPILGVYILDEIMVPDGDGNAGHIRFTCTTRIGFQVIIGNNDEAAAEAKLDAAYWQIMNGIWRDAGITNLILAKTPDNVGFESIMRGTRRHVWGAIGANNETPTAELQYEASIVYRDEFAVPVTDDLLEIWEQTGFTSDHDGTTDAVEQVEVDYTFTPASELMRGKPRSKGNGRNTNTSTTSVTGAGSGIRWRGPTQGGPQGAARGNRQE